MSIHFGGFPAGGLRGPQASERPTGVSAATPVRPTGSQQPPTDAVSLTGQSVKLREASQELAAGPAIDEGRVSAIRAAIADGRYKVDPDRLAERMLAQESDLFGAP